MTKTLIRHAITADFETLLEIDTSSFSEGVAYDAAELAHFINQKGAETIVLERNRTIVAFLIMDIHANQRTATLVTLDVREEERRNGHASQLLKRSEEILGNHGVEVYDLQVDVNNRPAISFYRKHGFQTVRILKNYYANGNDAFLMMKELV